MGVLLRDKWFRLMAFPVFLLGVAVVLMLPKIWLRTPADFDPEIRVSWLDLIQSRSLKKSAIRHDEAGRIREAIHSWNGAIINDPGDPDLARGGVRSVLRQKSPSDEHIGFGFQRLMWLLRLTETNRVDAELAVEFLSRFELDTYVVRSVATRADELSDGSAKSYLRSLYRSGDYVGFDNYWTSREAAFEKDPELKLYRSAWMAVHGPPITLTAGRAQLRDALASSDRRLLAARLQLQVAFLLQDLSSFEEALRVLEDAHLDRPSDNALYWRLIWGLGRREKATELARNYTRPPATAEEAVGMALSFETLGMREYAVGFLNRYQQTLGYSPQVWLQQLRMLQEMKDWQRIRELALAMRTSPLIGTLLDGYSYYAQGLAESRLGRTDAARGSLTRATELDLPDEQLALSVALSLRAEGYPALASKMMQKLEGRFGENVNFWLQLTMAAFESRDEELLIRSARRAHELNPKSPITINNYAAVLLATRTDPEEALKLTLSVTLDRPADRDAELNYILALLQNQRINDAEERLLSMNTLQLGPVQSSVYHLAWFELHVLRQEHSRARLSHSRIDQDLLVPVQAAWLQARFRELPELSMNH